MFQNTNIHQLKVKAFLSALVLVIMTGLFVNLAAAAPQSAPAEPVVLFPHISNGFLMGYRQVDVDDFEAALNTIVESGGALTVVNISETLAESNSSTSNPAPYLAPHFEGGVFTGRLHNVSIDEWFEVWSIIFATGADPSQENFDTILHELRR